jgi:hypothetical protein
MRWGFMGMGRIDSNGKIKKEDKKDNKGFWW